jgi:hypothetical protein
LLNKGRQTLPELLRASQLEAPVVKQALLVLLQHNMVQAWLQPEERLLDAVRPAQFLYEARLDAILQDTRCERTRARRRRDVRPAAPGGPVLRRQDTHLSAPCPSITGLPGAPR